MKKLTEISPRFFFSASIVVALFGLSSCTPTIQLDTPKEGIVINMNVVVDHNISVKMDEKAEKVVGDKSQGTTSKK